jgi:outer membrane protein OmpA-like peptidoglycan-associated protein
MKQINIMQLKSGKRTLSLFFLIGLFLLLSQMNGKAQVTDSIHNVWRNNWYIEAGVGSQLLFSSDIDNLQGKQRFTPAVSLSVGKWFSPLLGVRLQYNGYALNGYSDPTTTQWFYGKPYDPVTNQVTIHPDASYRHYLRYAHTHVDLRTSLFSLWKGIQNRQWDVIPSLGIGYLHTFAYKGTPATDNISTHFSLAGKYAINKEWDINLELSGTAFPGSFDGRITKQTYEAEMAATIGVTYNFGNRPSKLTPGNYYSGTVDSHKANNSVANNLLLQQLADINAKLNNVENKINALSEKKTEPEVIIKEVGVKKEPFILASIRFDLYQSKPIEGQEINFTNIVKYIENNPNAKIRLEGYGNKENGTAEANLRISKKRVETVRRTLKDKYGIDDNQIETRAIGTESQPYENSEWNRIVTVTMVE